MIGQSVGSLRLVPIAVARLELEPLAEGNYYAGDLLCNVLRVERAFWDGQSDLRKRMMKVAASARDTTEETAVRGQCDAFLLGHSKDV